MANLTRLQSGSVTIGTSSTSNTATVSSYTAAQSVLKISVRGGSASPTDDMIRAVKTDATTLTFTRTGSTVSTIIQWELWEFDSTVAVQDISVSGEGTTAITAVTLSQSWMNITGLGANSGFSGKYAPVIQFNSTTEIELDTDNVAWATGGTIQVVDYTGCAVQNLTRTLTTSTATSTSVTPTSVDTGATWVTASMKVDGNPVLFDAGFWRCLLASAVSVSMARSAGTSFTFNFNVFVVEHTDGLVVQDFSTTLLDGSSIANNTLSAVDTDNTGTVLGGCNAYGWATGLTNHAGDSGTHCMITSVITSTTNVRQTRVGTTDNVAYNIQVLEFAVGAGGGGSAAAYGSMLNHVPRLTQWGVT